MREVEIFLQNFDMNALHRNQVYILIFKLLDRALTENHYFYCYFQMKFASR